MEKQWHLTKIPKIFHCYYGGKLSYLSYLTVVSFIKHNPDWHIMFYYPKFPTNGQTWESNENKHHATYKDYTKQLFKLPISVTEIDFTDYDFFNDVSEVHKSDFLRLRLLSSIGGLWSDMDIIYFNPITNIFINRPEYKHKDTVVSISEYGHSIGFMMASYDNMYFSELFKNVFEAYSRQSYQCMGSELCNRLYPKLADIPGNPVNIGMDAVYSMDANVIDRIYKEGEDYPVKELTHSIGLHWYAGHPLAGRFLNNTNGGTTDLPDNTISNLIKKIL